MGRQRDSKTTGVVERGGNTGAATWNDEKRGVVPEELEKSGTNEHSRSAAKKIKALKKKDKDVVGLPIQKFRFHSASSQPDTTLQKNIRLLGLAHIIHF